MNFAGGFAERSDFLDFPTKLPAKFLFFLSTMVCRGYKNYECKKKKVFAVEIL